jgi:hypothetical protein
LAESSRYWNRELLRLRAALRRNGRIRVDVQENGI